MVQPVNLQGARLDLVLNQGPTLFELATNVVIKNLDTHAVSQDCLSLCLSKTWANLTEFLSTTSFEPILQEIIDNRGERVTLAHFNELQKAMELEDLPLGIYSLAKLGESQSLVAFGRMLCEDFELTQDLETANKVISFFRRYQKIWSRFGITYADFSKNNLIKLSSLIFKIPNFTMYDFSANSLADFPECSKGSRHHEVKGLNFANNCFKEMPISITQCLQLRILKMERNRIHMIPGEICDLRHLFELDLSHNCIVDIPPAIGLLSNLHILNLSFNYICEIPSELGDCAVLGRLELACNRIHTIPRSLSRLSCLRKIDLSKNLIAKVPEEIFLESVRVIL
jgi:hypothetical protein